MTQRGYAREKSGTPPEVVARAVHHALTASRPRIRYRVGKDARLSLRYRESFRTGFWMNRFRALGFQEFRRKKYLQAGLERAT